MEKRKEAGCALAASLLAGALALPTAALEVSQAWGVEPEAAKDEVVYVKAGADGATQGLYVVNVFDTGSVQTVDDPARYTRVKNLTTTDALVQENGAVQVSTLADQPFYYEGEMDAATPLPWDVSLTYYLDGAQIAPDELAGKSGRLRIEFAVTARGGDAEAAGLADFAESCVMQAQGTFPESAFKVEEAEGATVAHVGDNAVISYLVLPGESAVYAIEGDARAFSYEGWQISAMPLGLAIDLAEQDTAQLSDKTGELEDATAQLSDGAASLESGLGSLASGSGDLAYGTGEVAAGATELAGGASSLARGSEELQAGVGAAVDGLASVSANSAALDAAAERVRAGGGRPRRGRAGAAGGRPVVPRGRGGGEGPGRRRRRAVRGRTGGVRGGCGGGVRRSDGCDGSRFGRRGASACPGQPGRRILRRARHRRGKLCAAVGRHRRGGGLGEPVGGHGGPCRQRGGVRRRRRCARDAGACAC